MTDSVIHVSAGCGVLDAAGTAHVLEPTTIRITMHVQGGDVLELWGAYAAKSVDGAPIGHVPAGQSVEYSANLAPGTYTEGANVRSEDGVRHDAPPVTFVVPAACIGTPITVTQAPTPVTVGTTSPTAAPTSTTAATAVTAPIPGRVLVPLSARPGAGSTSTTLAVTSASVPTLPSTGLPIDFLAPVVIAASVLVVVGGWMTRAAGHGRGTYAANEARARKRARRDRHAARRAAHRRA